MQIDACLPIVGLAVPVIRVVVAVVAVVHILLFKLNSRSAVGWIALVLIFPLVGSLVYWVLGINRMAVEHRAISEPALRPSNAGRAPELEPGTSALGLVGHRVTGTASLPGNQIDLLQDGEQAFPAMLDAIARAEQEVLLMTYIFERDEIGEQFVAAMRGAQQRGVRVCVLLDDVGRRHNFPTILPKLRRANIETRCFNPLRLFPPNLGINLRNHRKMLIVDQRTCFAGGMNIGARRLTSASSRGAVSDLCFQFQGPIVAATRQVFLHDWCRSGGADIGGVQRSVGPASGDSVCRLVVDGPNEQLDNLTLSILGVISAAEHRIVLITPYFLPNARIVGALQAAVLRGVEVNIVIPAKCNWPMVRWALNHRIVQLLKVGVTVWEQPPPFAHSKLLLVDDAYALVGSANIDARSLRLNFELGIEIFDTHFCKELEVYADRCLARGLLISSSSIRSRSSFERLRDSIASLFDPYL